MGGKTARLEFGELACGVVRSEAGAVDSETAWAATQAGLRAIAVGAGAASVDADAVELAPVAASPAVAWVGGGIDAASTASALSSSAPLLPFLSSLVPGQRRSRWRDHPAQGGGDTEDEGTGSSTRSTVAQCADEGVECMGVHENAFHRYADRLGATAPPSSITNRSCVDLAIGLRPRPVAAGVCWQRPPPRHDDTIGADRRKSMATVVLAGTLDTKGIEYAFVRDRLREQGVDVILVDVGVLGSPLVEPDVSREEVARAGGVSLASLIAAGDRGRAIEVMSAALGAVVKRLYAEARLDAILGLGGGGGSALLAAAMCELPIETPKLLVSTMVGGDTRAFAGVTGITVMHSIVDIAGLNRISERVFAQAAAAGAAMANANASMQAMPLDRPLLGATMFGVTTPCVTAARERLEALGYEVLVFHATGTGGNTLEQLVRDGVIIGVLDVTTTELADDLVGGVLSAGPERLTASGDVGIPQVVSLGALDMVNFGPIETIPEQFKGRLLYKHNPAVTLMRTTPEENAELGKRLAGKLNRARGPVTLFIPLRGVSLIAVEGQVFHDPVADAALFDAIRRHIADHVAVREIDTDINDPAYATAMADALHESYTTWSAGRERTTV
jgi:uncharacterized protein (UPF0261 family)